MTRLRSAVAVAGWRGAALAFGLLLAGCGGGTNDTPVAANAEGLSSVKPLAAAAPAEVASVTELLKVGEKRIGRTVYEYQYRITVRNGATPLAGVSAQLDSVGPGTTLVDGSVQVGDLPANAVVSPADTITLRHDRTLAFQPALLMWRFASAGPVPASLALAVAQRVVGAGVPLALMPTVVDAAGTSISPLPAIAYQIVVPAEGSLGTVPAVVGGQVITGADTRGSYVVRASIAGVGLVANASFTVIQNAAQSGNAALYSGLSAAQSVLDRQLKLAADAQARGDAPALAAAVAAIAAAAGTVDVVKMSGSTAYEPDIGFVPTTGKLAANGIHPVAADAVYGTTTAALRSKLAQITSLLNQPSANDAADTALLARYGQDLAAIAATLQSAAASPSTFGVVQHGDAISDMLALDMPLLLKAMAARLQTQAGLARAAAVDQPKALRAGATPDFLLTGLIGAMGPMGALVVKVYGDYLDQLERTIILLALKDLLDAKLTQLIRLQGVLSGAALLGPYAYNYPNSYIDLSGVSLPAAQNADVYLIGGAAVKALTDAGKTVLTPPEFRSINDVLSYFNNIIEAIDAVRQAHDLAHQQPDFVIPNSFSENFGCLPSLSDDCIEMHYNNGFKNVSGGSVSFTVLMLVRTRGPQPQYGTKLLNFAPGT